MRRFHQARHGPGLIHTVEVSEPADPCQFVTLWLKGDEGQAWAREQGLEDHHDPDRYHAGEGNYAWGPKWFPDWNKRSWGKHRHIDLAAGPQWTDLERFASQMGPGLAEALKRFLTTEER